MEGSSLLCNPDTEFKIEEEWYSEDVRKDMNVKWYNCIVRKIKR